MPKSKSLHETSIEGKLFALSCSHSTPEEVNQFEFRMVQDENAKPMNGTVCHGLAIDTTFVIGVCLSTPQQPAGALCTVNQQYVRTTRRRELSYSWSDNAVCFCCTGIFFLQVMSWLERLKS